MVAIGPRPSGSPELRETRAYLTRQLAAAGLTVQEQRFVGETPRGPVDMVNLIVRLPGRRADRIVIGGHYDTKLMPGMRFVGASDGASSAAFLVELARALKGRPHDLTYELVWFDGEEAVCRGWDDCGKPGSPDNTYGSRYYVQAAKTARALPSIKAMILVDMIGADGLILRRETKSTAWLTDTIWSTARRLAYGHVFVDASLPVEDDHEAFLDAGIPSVDLIDLQDYPYWHTADDTLAHVSARSLQIVGDVLIAALPEIEARLGR
jgi:Zn-dependent M28 family amino/carboxypeptidase